VMATLLQKDGTVYDLEEAELCYGEGCWSILLYYSESDHLCFPELVCASLSFGKEGTEL